MDLKKKYNKKIIFKLIKKFNFSSIMQVPKIIKIIISSGFNSKLTDSKKINYIINEMAIITGQKPIITYAKKSISNFKIRKKMQNGCKITLRNKKMYDFLNKLIVVVLPRIRDFRGLSIKSFDGRGNYTFGIKEHFIFPEVNFDKIKQNFGLNITIVTDSNNDNLTLSLLTAFGMPFKKRRKNI